MGAEPGILLQNVECSAEVIHRRAEQGRLRRMQRDVEVDPPFAVELRPIALGGRQSLVQVGMTDELPIGPSLDHLVEVHAIVERGQDRPDLMRRMHAERVAEVDLADPDPAPMQPLERFPGGLELERKVAGIVIDAQVLSKPQIPGSVRLQLSEEGEELGGVLDRAERLRLEPKVELTTRPSRQLLLVVDTSPQVVPGNGQLTGSEPELLEAHRHRADGSLDPFGHEFGEDVEQPVRVGQALRGGPVGLADLLLHPGSMEVAEGKSVDREDVAAVALEPTLEVPERSRDPRSVPGTSSSREAASLSRRPIAYGASGQTTRRTARVWRSRLARVSAHVPPRWTFVQ